MSGSDKFNFKTLSLHAGHRPDPLTGARAVPQICGVGAAGLRRSLGCGKVCLVRNLCTGEDRAAPANERCTTDGTADRV